MAKIKPKTEEIQQVEVTESQGLSVVDKQKQENKKRFLEALEKSLGIISTASVKANVARQTIYNYMAEDPVFKSMVESVQELTLDFAESALLKRIQEGSDAAIIFYMKTKGKKRGFIEKPDIGDGGDNDVRVTRPTFLLPDGTKVEL